MRKKIFNFTMVGILVIALSAVSVGCKQKIEEITTEAEVTEATEAEVTADEETTEKAGREEKETTEKAGGKLVADGSTEETTEKPGKKDDKTTEKPGRTTESTTERERTTESTTERERTTESTTEHPRTTESTTESPRTTESTTEATTEVYEVWVEKILQYEAYDEPIYTTGYECNGCHWQSLSYEEMYSHIEGDNISCGSFSTCQMITGYVHHHAKYTLIHHMSDGSSWREPWEDPNSSNLKDIIKTFISRIF